MVQIGTVALVVEVTGLCSWIWDGSIIFDAIGKSKTVSAS